MGGSDVEAKTLQSWRILDELHEWMFVERLCPKWPESFPMTSCSRAALADAHALYHSRAMSIPFPPSALKGNFSLSLTLTLTLTRAQSLTVTQYRP